jgi:hypothetical protein
LCVRNSRLAIHIVHWFWLSPLHPQRHTFDHRATLTCRCCRLSSSPVHVVHECAV